jgi:hypothetical protein
MMGYYISTPISSGKAKYLADRFSAIEVDQPEWSNVPEGNALICVVDNGPFESAAFCYDEREFKAFLHPEDKRPKTWLLMDRTMAEDLTGFGKI